MGGTYRVSTEASYVYIPGFHGKIEEKSLSEVAIAQVQAKTITLTSSGMRPIKVKVILVDAQETAHSHREWRQWTTFS